jgi:DNA repair exonuclease SbcCD ATPase subunit
MNYRLTMASQGTRLDSLRTDQSVTENSAERLTAVREEIKQLKIDAEEALERTRVAEQKATEAKEELDSLYATQKSQRDDLETKKTKYEGDQKSLETRSSTLDKEIEELARQEREREEKAKAEAEQKKSSGGNAPVAGSANTGGGWVYPRQRPAELELRLARAPDLRHPEAARRRGLPRRLRGARRRRPTPVA